MPVIKILPHPLTSLEEGGSKVKHLNFAITQSFVNIFTEISPAAKVTIDMKYIKRDFSLKAWIRPPGWTKGVG